ncbi:MAG: hypothetical protein AAF560_25870 [Acidobacteriota bacterium]
MLERFRGALRAEARKRHGWIGEIEKRAGLRRGGISDVYSGRVKDFRAVLRALDALEIEHREFFSRALGVGGRPEDDLAELEVGAEDDDSRLAELERVAIRLEAETPLACDPLAVEANVDELLSDITRCNRREQERRLRVTRRYRSHAFARAYLEHLDSLRYDAPDDAAKLASWVIRGVLPKLGEPTPERLELLCLALGIYGSARRVRGRYPATARAFRVGLDLARRHRLGRTNAELLQRASYLLRDLARFESALVMLNEAVVLYVELESEVGIGKALVDRGMMLTALGEHYRAIRSLEQASSLLEGSLPRTQYTAFYCLAYACEQQGDLDAAERHLQVAIRMPGLEEGFFRGRLLWLRGTLTLRRGEHKRAEALLRRAREVLGVTENPGQIALVSLDLLDSVLAQGEVAEACALACDMASLLEAFETRPLAGEAIAKLIRPALAGRLSRAAVAEARAALKAHGALSAVIRSAL